MKTNQMIMWGCKLLGYCCVVTVLYLMFYMKENPEPNMLPMGIAKMIPLVAGYYLFKRLASKYGEPG